MVESRIQSGVAQPGKSLGLVTDVQAGRCVILVIVGQLWEMVFTLVAGRGVTIVTGTVIKL